MARLPILASLIRNCHLSKAYANEVIAFEQALRGESKPVVTCHDSCRTTHICEHASISSRKGRPVAISFEGMEAAAAYQ